MHWSLLLTAFDMLQQMGPGPLAFRGRLLEARAERPPPKLANTALGNGSGMGLG